MPRLRDASARKDPPERTQPQQLGASTSVVVPSRVPSSVPQLPEFSLRAVAAFVSVAQYGSFRRAGNHLYLDPSTVSKLIRQLEHALGHRLFERSTRAVHLTTRGIATLPIAESLLRTVAELLQPMATESAGGSARPP